MELPLTSGTKKWERCWSCFVANSVLGFGESFLQKNCVDELNYFCLCVYDTDYSLCISNSLYMRLQALKYKLIIVCEKLCREV